VRAGVVGRLLDRGARVTFVAHRLLADLAAALPPPVGDRLLAASHVELAPIEVPSRDSLMDPRASLGLAPGASYVAWVGRVVGSKRPGLAVAAAREAGLPLVVAGDGPDLEGLRARAGSVATQTQVVLAGRLPRDRALAIVARASVLLHTSEAEGAPTAVREARALGVPVVACAAGDLEAWATLDDGIHLADATVPAIAAALRRAVGAGSVPPARVLS
jgi:glycosyltransferase involved in cell wall biosynthesis